MDWGQTAMIALPQFTQVSALSLAQGPPSQADLDRKREMSQAWEAYRGRFQRPLKVSANQPDDNVISNRCAPIVDKGVSFLFGQTLTITAPDGNDAINDYITGLWGDDDDKMTLLSQLGINGAVCGMTFAKLIPPQGQMKFPRIVVMNPQLIRVITSPDDCTLPLAYVIEYPTVNEYQKRQIIARVDPDGLASIAGGYDLDDTWSITNYLRRGSMGTWSQVGDEEEWPYPFAPIFCCQNLSNPNEIWGVPDLTSDLIEQNKVLNFVQSNTSRILKFHAHPKTYATGLSASQINIGVDDLICLPSPESKLNNLEMHSDLASSLNFIANIRSDMDEQSRVPAVALGRLVDLPKGNLSGVALQLLFQPIVEKTTIKQRLYGGLIRDISRAALVMAGLISLEEYEDYKINLEWQRVIPADDLTEAQKSVLLLQIGASKTTLLAQLGFDPDVELENLKKESEETMNNWSQGQGLPPTKLNPNQQQDSAVTSMHPTSGTSSQNPMENQQQEAAQK